MKKILAIILIEILIFSGSGIFVTVQSEQNDITISDSNNYDDACDCEVFMKNDNTNSYGYYVMKQPLYVDDSKVLNSLKPSIVSTPDEFSWKDYEGQDWTTIVKNQGNCGSCWDFAALGALESIIKIKEQNSNLSPDLSEQYVLSCLPAAANNYGKGCWGGTPYGAFYYMMDTSSEGNNKNGAIPESCFPYKASHSVSCSDKCETWEDFLVPILNCSESYLGFDSPENREIIKSLIYQNGPIAAAMNVTQDFINFWSNHHSPTDYFQDPEAPWGNMLNHIIVILGWKNDSSIDNGGYWICKNSWGTSWGYQGFYNIEYGALFTGFYISTVEYDPESFDWSPTAPTISGTKEGIPGNNYTYKLKSEDPDGNDDIYYYVDWGDGTNTGWLGPYIEGEEIAVNHTWTEKGIYVVKAKAKDLSGYESEWGKLTVTMPRDKTLSKLNLLRYLCKFPLLNRIISFTKII
jgi:C1A family cysteine protease